MSGTNVTFGRSGLNVLSYTGLMKYGRSRFEAKQGEEGYMSLHDPFDFNHDGQMSLGERALEAYVVMDMMEDGETPASSQRRNSNPAPLHKQSSSDDSDGCMGLIVVVAVLLFLLLAVCASLG